MKPSRGKMMYNSVYASTHTYMRICVIDCHMHQLPQSKLYNLSRPDGPATYFDTKVINPLQMNSASFANVDQLKTQHG